MEIINISFSLYVNMIYKENTFNCIINIGIYFRYLLLYSLTFEVSTRKTQGMNTN